MESSSPRHDETFEVSDSLESVEATPENEGANVCRVAAISTMLGNDRKAIRDVSDELAALGFPQPLSSGDFAWDTPALPALFDVIDSLQNAAELRMGAWQALRVTARVEPASAFVVAVLGSELERESAVAAAVLSRLVGPSVAPAGRPGPVPWDVWASVTEFGPAWPGFTWWDLPEGEAFGFGLEGADRYYVEWRPDLWSVLYSRTMADAYSRPAALSLLARSRLRLALYSRDPVTRSLAQSAFLATAAEAGYPPGSLAPRSPGIVRSTMIHGTWGWKGDWWRPRPGSFHNFILNNHRRNLYNGGARFSWSGAYDTAERTLAASDFCDWASEMAVAGLQTVLAHSYGGEIAARSKIAGARIDQIVLLSSPVNSYIATVANDPTVSVVDVRLKFDPVLASARVRQRIRPLPPTVTEVILAAWRLDHGATHNESVWLAENVAGRGGI